MVRVKNIPSLILLEKRNVGEASLVLARAFQDDPLSSYFFPNPDERIEMLPAFFEFRLRSAVRHGMVYTTSTNMEGVAAWLPSDFGEESMLKMLWHGGYKLFRKVGNSGVVRMTAAGDYATSLRKKNAGNKYIHLEMLVVEPKFQGMGFARNLLEPMFEWLDSQNLPCYLETTSEKNVPFYQYLGFEVVDENTIPESSVRIWDMIRKPFTS